MIPYRLKAIAGIEDVDNPSDPQLVAYTNIRKHT
jgi:hypothetical protein